MRESRTKEARMCVTQKELEKLQGEAKTCEMSLSDYLKIMFIFGKMYVGGNKMITKELISLRIWAIRSVFEWFSVDTNQMAEFDFLMRKQGEFERRKKIK